MASEVTEVAPPAVGEAVTPVKDQQESIAISPIATASSSSKKSFFRRSLSPAKAPSADTSAASNAEESTTASSPAKKSIGFGLSTLTKRFVATKKAAAGTAAGAVETPTESVNASAVQDEANATLAEDASSKSKELTEVLDQDVPAPIAIPTAIEHQNTSWFWSACRCGAE